jgi:multidrug efflux pump subunit AcrB
MNNIIAWFANNKVAANLLMIFIIVAGLISLISIKLEVFPELSPDRITISVIYQGAAPEEVEEGVCVKIEEAVQDLVGIKKIMSLAAEGTGTVTIEVRPNYDGRKLLEDIKTRVDAISTFPLETEKPVVQEVLIRRQVINVAVSGQTDERTLKQIGEQIRDEINELPEVSQVDLTGTKPYEVSIEVSEEILRNYGLTFDEVARAVKRSSLDLPGGSISTAGGEISLRTKGQAYSGQEFGDIILRSYADGTRLRLSDVVQVVDAFAENDQASRFDGKPSVLVQVFRVGDENALTIASAVKAYIQKRKSSLPEGIILTPWQDDSLVLKDRMSLLMRNARWGFLLVFMMLALFLRLRLAVWVSVGMVISFFGAFWVLPWFGVSINQISLFAFILVLGIVVDDAIIVGENIYSHLQRGEKPLQAAISGAQRVAKPVIFAVLTSIAAFSPLLGVPGMMGDVMKMIPIVVIATLSFSLIESLLILPAHLSNVNIHKTEKKKNGLQRRFKDLQDRFSNFLDKVIHIYYKQTLETALQWRYTFLAAGIGLLIFTLAIAAGGALKFSFMTAVEADNVVALLTMPDGTTAEETIKVLKKLENSADKLKAELNSPDQEVVKHILTTIAEQPFTKMSHSSNAGQNVKNRPNLGEINIQLAPAEARNITSEEVAERWRELSGDIPDVEELVFSSSMFSTGNPIDIQLKGIDYEELQVAAIELKSIIATYPGTYDISDSYRSGKQEIKLRLKPQAEALGLTLNDLARQVRQAFYGEEVQRIQRGRDEIKVMVRYPKEERQSLGDLENMRVRLPGGEEIPFSIAAEIEQGYGFSSISRTDRMRTINIYSSLDLSIANANEVIADIQKNVMPEIVQKYPSVRYSLEGEQAEQKESMAGIMEGFMIALLLIYILLAIPFSSYLQPFIVMSAIPFGIVGALWGHIFMGMDLSIMSMFGIVALAGVVINDSLVLVDVINRERREGSPLMEAIGKAAIARFRPIILTSVTTFAGLTPLLLEQSPQAQMLIPMAVSLAYGVMFGTFITLILVPVIYYSQEDIKRVFKRMISKEESEVELEEIQINM